MLKRVKALRLGPGDVAGMTVGPLIHEAAAAKVARHVADAVSRGARLLCGGQVDPALGRAFLAADASSATTTGDSTASVEAARRAALRACADAGVAATIGDAATGEAATGDGTATTGEASVAP